VQVEISAGGVVYKRTKKGLKISLMLDPFGRWTFAKGHVEPGETIEQAALRETAEEMALHGLRLRQPLGTIDFWFREKYRVGSKGMLVHKFVHYFLMEAPSGEWGSPQKDEKIRQITWVDPREAIQKSSYEDVRPVLEKALIALGVRKPPNNV
jgi:ADP-ribose pyrophosphatase YjhB (NUDIX family)